MSAMNPCQWCGDVAADVFCASCGEAQEQITPGDPWRPVPMSDPSSIGRGHYRYQRPSWPDNVFGDVYPGNGDIETARSWSWTVSSLALGGEWTELAEGECHSLSAAKEVVEAWSPPR